MILEQIRSIRTRLEEHPNRISRAVAEAEALARAFSKEEWAALFSLHLAGVRPGSKTWLLPEPKNRETWKWEPVVAFAEDRGDVIKKDQISGHSLIEIEELWHRYAAIAAKKRAEYERDDQSGHAQYFDSIFGAARRKELLEAERGELELSQLLSRVRLRVQQFLTELESELLQRGRQDTELHNQREGAPLLKPRIFVGHGRSETWRSLGQFVVERLGLDLLEFSRVSPAGVTTTDRLAEFLQVSDFAFLVLTAEDEHVDGKISARANVVHELGLFQGRLGPKRAIAVLEDGCDEFSNIAGLGQIRFPRGTIGSCFEEVRKVLEREGLLPGPRQ